MPCAPDGASRAPRIPPERRPLVAAARSLGLRQANALGPREEAPDSPYWRLIDPIMDQRRKGKTIDQIAVYLGLKPGAVRRHVDAYDRLHPDDQA